RSRPLTPIQHHGPQVSPFHRSRRRRLRRRTRRDRPDAHGRRFSGAAAARTRQPLGVAARRSGRGRRRGGHARFHPHRRRGGEWLLAIGSPFQLNQTVTAGIVSATGRNDLGFTQYEDFIQTDAAINPGNSGGALVNTRGELVGINTGIYSESGGYQGIGFAVPSNLARRIVDDLMKFGEVRRGTIGYIGVEKLTPQLAEEVGATSLNGALI